ncbi:MAG: YqgE/AlgH family protein [Planctomycetota bacterium]
MDTNRFNFGADSSKLHSNPISFCGQLLVSTERLNGTGFEKSVVLLMQDDQRGTFGVALNKPANQKVKNAWSKLTGSEVGDDFRIVAGGPLQGPVFALHQNENLGDVAMPGGLYISAQIEKVQQLVQQQDDPYRIFVGVSGWQPGQLESELNSGYWYSLPLDVETVFDDPEWMWDFCLQEFGRNQIEDIVGECNMPDDPAMN